MRYLSVCSGIEAATVAWHPLGWQPLAFAEIEKFPSAVLAHHYPAVPNLGDMTTIDTAHWRDQTDVLVGGTPCQAFSVAGLRRSLDDARGNLTLQFVRLADELDPRYVVWENVPGVLNTKDNAFGCLLAGLAGEDEPLVPSGKKWSNAGYVLGPKRAVAWRVLDAQYFGVAQRRRRVFVVASSGDGADPGEILFEFDGVRRDSPPSREAGEETAGALASRTGAGGFPGTDEACQGYVQAVALRGRDAGGTAELGGPGAHALRASGGGGDKPHVLAFGGGNRDSIHVATTTTTAHQGRYDYESETFVMGFQSKASPSNSMNPGPVMPTMDKGKADGLAVCITGSTTHALTAEGHDASEDGTGRGTPITAFAIQERAVADTNCGPGGKGWQEGVAYTLEARNKTQYAAASGMAVRRLLPTECEALQGFPRNYTRIPWRNKPASECPDGPRYKALGNSMAVPVMAWIGRRIAAADAAAGNQGELAALLA